ncbi:MAG: PilN domain-containing protein [Pseudomonadota bacterium]
MTRINLLPWREARRKELQRQFVSILLGSLILMVAIIFYAHIHIGALIERQNARNDFLNKEIAALDERIKEINTLETEKARLLARMGIIQELQSSRPLIVHLVDELVTNLPDGVHYTRVQLKDTLLTLEGVAQSNARVSQLMRNLEVSPWLENPVLDIIETNEKDRERVSRYVLRVSQRQQPSQMQATQKVVAAQ